MLFFLPDSLKEMQTNKQKKQVFPGCPSICSSLLLRGQQERSHQSVNKSSESNYFSSPLLLQCLNRSLFPSSHQSHSSCHVLCLRPFVKTGPQRREALPSSEPAGGLRRRRPHLRSRDRPSAAGEGEVWQRTSHWCQHGERPQVQPAVCLLVASLVVYLTTSCLWLCSVLRPKESKKS